MNIAHKLFPHTYSGDQIRVEFTHAEERAAFESLVEALTARVAQNGETRETAIQNFDFPTTLMWEVAKEYGREIKEIVGLGVMNLSETKASNHIVPLPARKA